MAGRLPEGGSASAPRFLARAWLLLILQGPSACRCASDCFFGPSTGTEGFNRRRGALPCARHGTGCWKTQRCGASGDRPDGGTALSIATRHNITLAGTGRRAMVFAHGFGCDQNMWRYVAPAFEDQFRTVLF